MTAPTRRITTASPAGRGGRRVGAVLAVAALSAGVLLSGCGSGAEEPQDAQQGSGAPVVEVVDGAAALALVRDGATVVDVRTPEEFQAGHVDGAVNVDLQSDTFLEQVGELPADRTYVVYCASGNRSAQATALMSDAGFTDLYDAGGFDALVEAGAPTAEGAGD